MKSLLLSLLLLGLFRNVFCFSRKFNTKINNIDYSYEIPDWVYKRKIFKNNRIPKFSNYHKKNKVLKSNFISEEEAHYNAIKECNLPFGLLQYNVKI